MALRALLVAAVALRVAAEPSVPVVDVFSRGEAGYYCIKIPYLLSLPNGELLALAEARSYSCSDSAKTDLVMKRSRDGQTWSELSVFHSGPGVMDTIGNAAPIIVGNDIVVPFQVNNSLVLMKRSHDLGVTWSKAQDITANTTLSSWGWVGIGPPAGLRLSSGRLLVPGYHTNKSGTGSKGFALLSDDAGHTWRLSSDHDFGGHHFPNEPQAVELPGGRVASFARGLLSHRTRTVSPDGGEHWGPTEVLETLTEPFAGCEGSTVACPGDSRRLVYSGPMDTMLRDHMSIYTSDDEGKTWQKFMLVDAGESAYSALVWRGDKMGMLYERAKHHQLIFEPDQISYVQLPSPCSGTLVV